MSKIDAKTLAALEKLGISTVDVERAQARKAKQEATEATRALLAEPMAQVIAGMTMAPSASSTWVGASVSFDLDGYGVKVVVTDKAASDARKSA